MSLPTAPLRHGRLHPSPAHIYIYLSICLSILCKYIYLSIYLSIPCKYMCLCLQLHYDTDDSILLQLICLCLSISIYMYIYILCIPIYTHNLRSSLSRTLTVALRHGRLHPPPARRHQDLHVGRPAPAMRPHAIPLHPAHVPPRAHRAWRIRPRSRRRAKDNLQLSAG